MLGKIWSSSGKVMIDLDTKTLTISKDGKPLPGFKKVKR